MQFHCERSDQPKPEVTFVKQEATFPATLDDEVKLRDYYKPKIEPSNSANANLGASVLPQIDPLNLIRQQQFIHQQQYSVSNKKEVFKY